MTQGRTMHRAYLAGIGLFGLLALIGGPAAAQDQEKSKDKAQKGNPSVVLETSEGNITIELYPDKAPKTVENFLKYVDDGFYNGTLFHRVIPGFMIQGGGFAREGAKEKDTRDPVKNESRTSGVSNARGTVAMARTNDPDSATSQFFINLGDNSRLDSFGGGYTAFGKVVEGMDVVDKIARVPTGVGTLEMKSRTGDRVKAPNEDVPTRPVEIKSARRKGAK